MKLVIMILALLLTLSTSFADRGGGKTREALMQACKADIEKYCKGVELGEGRLIQCMKKNEDKLSEGCKKEREIAKEHFKGRRGEIIQACKSDVETYCKKMRGPRNRIDCLKNEPKVSANCKAVLPQR